MENNDNQPAPVTSGPCPDWNPSTLTPSDSYSNISEEHITPVNIYQNINDMPYTRALQPPELQLSYQPHNHFDAKENVPPQAYTFHSFTCDGTNPHVPQSCQLQSGEQLDHYPLLNQALQHESPFANMAINTFEFSEPQHQHGSGFQFHHTDSPIENPYKISRNFAQGCQPTTINQHLFCPTDVYDDNNQPASFQYMGWSPSFNDAEEIPMLAGGSYLEDPRNVHLDYGQPAWAVPGPHDAQTQGQTWDNVAERDSGAAFVEPIAFYPEPSEYYDVLDYAAVTSPAVLPLHEKSNREAPALCLVTRSTKNVCNFSGCPFRHTLNESIDQLLPDWNNIVHLDNMRFDEIRNARVEGWLEGTV